MKTCEGPWMKREDDGQLPANSAGLGRVLRLQSYLQLDVERKLVFMLQIRQRLRILIRKLCLRKVYVTSFVHDSTWFQLSKTNGANASMGTTQGEMVVAKFFAKKGPRGTYSHFWMSRALQSFINTMPKMYLRTMHKVCDNYNLMELSVLSAINGKYAFLLVCIGHWYRFSGVRVQWDAPHEESHFQLEVKQFARPKYGWF